MSYRRAMRCGAITFVVLVALPHVSTAAADDGRHDNEVETEDCDDASSIHDDGHAAGERDRAHEHDGREAEQEDKSVEDDDDCVIAPPTDVPEAPQALLLSASAVVTGGTAVLIIRRRSKGAHTAKA